MRNNKNNDLNNHSLSNISHITINYEPIDDNHIVHKAYVDSLSENERSRRDLSRVFNDQDNEFDNNRPKNLDSITVNRNPTLDDKLSNKK